MIKERKRKRGKKKPFEKIKYRTYGIFLSRFFLLIFSPKNQGEKKKEKKKAMWQPHIYRNSRGVNIGEAETASLGALASRDAKKKKPYFTSSNTTLSILPTHFTTHYTFQFLFLHTTQ